MIAKAEGEDALLFSTATSSITMIIDAKRQGDEITRDFVEKIVANLQSQEMNYSFVQQQSAGAAILISARCILPRANTAEKLELIPLFRQGLEMVSSFDKLPGFLWTNAHPLFHTYLESIPKDTPGARKILEFLQKIVDVLKLSPVVNNDFFEYHSIITLGRLIQNTMNIVGDEDRDVELRKQSLELISSVVQQCPPNKAPTVSLFVSGLLVRLVRVLKTNATNAVLIENSILLMKNAIVLTFADKAVRFDMNEINLENYHPEMHRIFLNQTPEWRTEGADFICDYIRDLLSYYMVHRVHNVRVAVCQLVMEVQQECAQLFGQRLYSNLLFMYMHLRYDDFPYFQDIAETCLTLVKNKRMAETFFYKKLDIHTSRLPVRTRNEDGTREIKILCSILNALGGSVRLMCTTGARTMELLLKSLCDSIVINKKKIMITSDSAAESVCQALRKMKLQYDISHPTVMNICEILAGLGGIEVIDMVLNQMRIETAGKRASYHIMMGYLLSAFDPSTTPADDPIIMMLAEYLVEETNKSCVIKLKSDAKPHSSRYEIDWNTCVESLSLTNLALCMRFIGKTRNRSWISTSCLCTVLMQTTSTSWIVSESAEFALKIMAEERLDTPKSKANALRTKLKNDPRSVHRLIRKYSSHILNRVSQACSSDNNYHMAPILLKAYLKYAGVIEHFDAFRVIVEKMIYALDNNQQKYTYSLLQAMVSFVEVLNEDYPKHEPIYPSEDSEDNRPLPTPQHIIVEKILLRTKHMLTSRHLSVKITVLELLAQGIEFLKCYDDMLLPMIHQNWFGMMSIARELEPVTLAYVIDRVADMANKSGSFVHNKVLKEFWPIVEDYFMTQMVRTNHFEESADFALATKIISKLPQIVVNSGLTQQEANDSYLKLVHVSIEKTGPFVFYCKLQMKKIEDCWKKNEKSSFDD